MRIKLFEAWMRPISQFDMNGNHIEDFECISDAARKTGIENTAISSVVNGRRKSTGGYIFKEREWNQKEVSNFIDFVKENDPDLLDDLKKYNENIKKDGGINKFDIIEEIRSLEYILNDEGVKVHKYGSKFDTENKLTISIQLKSIDDHEKFIRCDFFLEYIDRIEEMFHSENFFEVINTVDICVGGNTFVFIKKDGKKEGIGYRGLFQQENEELNFKEFFKTNKQKVKEKFLNLFEVDASDIDEILWDIRDEMEAINFKYELITPSSTLPVLIKDSKFKIDGDRWEYYSLNTIFSDAYRIRTTDKYLFNFTISFVLNCYQNDLQDNIDKIEDVCERISDIIQLDGGISITNRGTIDEFTIGHHIVYMNFFLFK